MTKTKIWLIVAASLVAAGILVFVGEMMVLGFDFNRIFFGGYQLYEVTHDVPKSVKNITIVSDTADIVFKQTQNGKFQVECCEQKNVSHVVSYEGDTLKINVLDTRKWYERLFSRGDTRITVYLPLSKYGELNITESTGDIKIPENFSFKNVNILLSTGDVECLASAEESVSVKSSTGDITLKNITANNVKLSVSTGKICAENIKLKGDLEFNVSTGDATLTNVTCNTLNSEGDTGDVKFTSVKVSEKLYLLRSTGDVTFDRCDAGEILVQTSTGNVKGSLLTEKIFYVNTSTGRVNVPETVSGGKCKITTSTGNVEISVVP